ncbi:2-C-methyl-D-erythritol 2,4-cyclodiphosphate synthase [Xylanivirga thermophila]|jgi:2-C-methyl-D-erythritol 2,4-cyclodiphosphate synthase|uniref:2-C-methyl-D-erythritol 2,4-cyclodiphosphate synthase n=1 Tax=Xylanivirga thermophila TaxID=2496273 RepID=UPI00101C126A|nr:2-C-methyl-D-erythritol 2,4-cyclodiphosphate synthase [Xylanivirga thermophila]
MRAGLGYDVHKLVLGRPLILGGVEIPYKYGLLGHSDADVLVHAIIDAILGAATLGDIGHHFPDTDERYKDISSLLLLKKTGDILRSKGYVVGNIDAVIIAQQPKLSPYIDEMRTNIAKSLMANKDDINIKATTTERLGFEGQGQGMAAQAIAIIF